MSKANNNEKYGDFSISGYAYIKRTCYKEENVAFFWGGGVKLTVTSGCCCLLYKRENIRTFLPQCWKVWRN